jgi:hypothetical protein
VTEARGHDDEVKRICDSLSRAPVIRIALDQLAGSDSPRADGTDPDHIQILAECGAELPPIVVHRPTMRVIDGLHRCRAAALRGESTIAARLFDGTCDDAFLIAVSANLSHGLPLALSDRRTAAVRIMRNHPTWSDRTIASLSGLSAKSVAGLRRCAGNEAQGAVREGQDGRVRPVNAAEGRRRATEFFFRRPGASLREIARAAGISVATARDVRLRIRAQQNPVPPQARRAEEVPHSADDHPDSWVATVAQLTRDPSLRFSASGRRMLRLLDAHAIMAKEWSHIVEDVPPHCGTAVAYAAEHVAQLWSEAAQKLELRDDGI